MRYAVNGPGMCGETGDPSEVLTWMTNNPDATVYIDAAWIAGRLRAANYDDIHLRGQRVSCKLDAVPFDLIMQDFDLVLGTPKATT